jgi:FtsP/CotA-like multicopper oxidase with cupredoxin domain
VGITRRDALALGAISALGVGSAAAIALGGTVSTKSASKLARNRMPKPYRVYLAPKPAPLTPFRTDIGPDGKAIHHYEVVERAGVANIVPGLPTRIWAYNGIFPGPRIEVEQGERATLRVRNKLPVTHPLFGHLFATSTHLHGSASLPEFDGYANDTTAPAQYKEYQYPNFQDARTLWYHDHAVHTTAQNVYTGLAAQYILHDPVERAKLPQGEYDVPLTITDAMFAADGGLMYDDRSHSGLWGDVILVNGQPWPVMKVKRRIYRFRMLNACLSRSFRFVLSSGAPMTIVGTDGGLVPVAQAVTSWRHAMAERYEVLIDFSRYAVGQRVELKNLSNPNNRDFDDTDKVMAFEIVGDAFDPADRTARTLPTSLNPDSAPMLLKESQAVKKRAFKLKRDDVTNEWNINGVAWREIVASGFTKVMANPRLNDVELWDFENASGGWFHPLHIHLVDFKILRRNGKPAFPWERGPKDVVYVGEGETVSLLMRFGPHKGRYMVHCHNLPHEDHDMMTQFAVGAATDPDFHDPLSAPPQLDNLG